MKAKRFISSFILSLAVLVLISLAHAIPPAGKVPSKVPPPIHPGVKEEVKEKGVAFYPDLSIERIYLKGCTIYLSLKNLGPGQLYVEDYNKGLLKVSVEKTGSQPQISTFFLKQIDPQRKLKVPGSRIEFNTGLTCAGNLRVMVVLENLKFAGKKGRKKLEQTLRAPLSCARKVTKKIGKEARVSQRVLRMERPPGFPASRGVSPSKPLLPEKSLMPSPPGAGHPRKIKIPPVLLVNGKKWDRHYEGDGWTDDTEWKIEWRWGSYKDTARDIIVWLDYVDRNGHTIRRLLEIGRTPDQANSYTVKVKQIFEYLKRNGLLDLNEITRSIHRGGSEYLWFSIGGKIRLFTSSPPYGRVSEDVITRYRNVLQPQEEIASETTPKEIALNTIKIGYSIESPAEVVIDYGIRIIRVLRRGKQVVDVLVALKNYGPDSLVELYNNTQQPYRNSFYFEQVSLWVVYSDGRKEGVCQPMYKLCRRDANNCIPLDKGQERTISLVKSGCFEGTEGAITIKKIELRPTIWWDPNPSNDIIEGPIVIQRYSHSNP